ncbi:von Willebrand factor A [Oleiphilus messinensis]|uniref:von Willebrand factor A n=1 Tax=Oleiphilus messinensis TaxID=141451 RepID=A0A1Y0II46_9GAMM|nr:VWA domain-containing protein [Oleiphilus messinensis]ARU59064.1 von Willebrand factor A [Oleiphilus messinensis]
MRSDFGVKRIFKTVVAGTMLASMTSSVFATESDAGQTLLVLDASGSMWGQIEGRSKIEIARSTIDDVSAVFDVDRAIGLMAYGHRNKGDCSDIELLLAPEQGAIGNVVSAVKAIRPKGKTPLTYAVVQAADILASQTRPATVILVTDGVETCGKDPCAVARSLEQKGVDFTAHVIGFGLDAEEGKQVACVAEATGGQFFLAEDGQGLAESLRRVAQEKPEPESETIPSATLNGPEADPVIGSAFNVRWTGPDGKQDYVDIVPKGYRETYGELSYAWVRSGQPGTIKAPGDPGEYELRYVWQGKNKKHVLAREALHVRDSDVALIAPKEANAGAMFAVQWRGPGGKGDYIDLVDSGVTETAGELAYAYVERHDRESQDRVTLQAPRSAGQYDIRYIMEAPDGRKRLVAEPITILAAKASLAVEDRIRAGAEFPVYWTGPGAPQDYIDLVPQGYTDTAGELSYFYTKSAPESGSLRAPAKPGNYTVRYILQASDGREVLTRQDILVEDVEARLTLAQSVSMGAALEVSWNGPDGKGDYIDLVPAGYSDTSGELSYFYTRSAPEKGALKVPGKPGNYQVRYVMEGATGRRVVASESITVEKASATLEFPAEVPVGERFSVTWSGPSAQGDYVDLVPAGYGETFGELSYFYTASAPGAGMLQAPDSAGEYRIRYILEAADGRVVLIQKAVRVVTN